MPKVTLDVAGMFFQIDVNVDEDATVEDVMNAAQAATVGGTGPKGTTFRYHAEKIISPSGLTLQTVNTITVVHRNGSAASRQTYSNGPSSRVYDDGIFSFSDNARFDDKGRFKPLNPNENFVLAWQYYIYDDKGNEHARSKNKPRQVVSYAEDGPQKEYELKDRFTVVWRLVAIFTGPTHASLNHIEKPLNLVESAEI